VSDEWKHREQEIPFPGIETLHRGAHFSARDLNPATPLYITVEDRLRISLFNVFNAPTVNITLRIQLPDGQVIPMVQAMTPASTRAAVTQELDLAEGFLLDLSVTTPTAAIRVGGLFAVAQIIRGTGANAILVRTLLSSYVTTGGSVGWPEGPNQLSTAGQGFLRAINQGNPAAGANWSVTVPNGARWLIQSVESRLVTSAAVANRIPHIVITDGAGDELFNSPASAAQAASLTVRYSACGGVQAAVNDGAAIVPIPDVASMLQGWTIGVTTTAIDVADQWSNIWLNLVEWNEQ